MKIPILRLGNILLASIQIDLTDQDALEVVLVQHDGRRGIEVVAEDQGPGIADVPQAMQDGFSTIGGLGSGLPGVARLMDECKIASAPGVGTRIVARKWWPCA